MSKIYLEGICTSFAILLITCFMNDVKIRVKMVVGLLATYLVLLPSLFITTTEYNIDIMLKIIYMISPIVIACLAFGINKIKSIIYTYLLTYGIIFYFASLIVFIFIPFNISEQIINIIDLSVDIVTVVLFLYIYLKKDIHIKVQQITSMPIRLKILILVLFWVSGMLCTFMLATINLNEISVITKVVFILSTTLIGLVGILVPILVLYNFSRDRYKLISKNYEAQVKSQLNHYKMMSKANADVREFRHDFNNLSLGLKDLLQRNQMEAALEFVDSCYEKANATSENLYKTGNDVVDALLNDKNQRASKLNTSIEFDGQVPTDIIDIEDLCIIFGVTLDNAIEACEKIEETKQKIISVNSNIAKHFLFIKISNPVYDNIIIENNHISTTKKDSKNHGIGLYSLKKSVEKYEGNVKFSCDNYIFTTEITVKIR